MPEETINEAMRKALKSARPRRTVSEVGGAMGTGYHRLSNIINGKVEPTGLEVSYFKSALGLPDYWPGSPPHLGEAKKGDLVSLSGTPLVSIPVVGNVAAMTNGPAYNVDVELQQVKVPESLAGEGRIGFIVDGDSMMPFLEEFDTAVFKKAHRSLHGYIYLLKLPDDGHVVKQVAFEDGEWYMVSLNTKYPKKLVPEGTQVLGMLIGWYRVRGSREKIDIDVSGLLP